MRRMIIVLMILSVLAGMAYQLSLQNLYREVVDFGGPVVSVSGDQVEIKGATQVNGPIVSTYEKRMADGELQLVLKGGRYPWSHNEGEYHFVLNLDMTNIDSIVLTGIEPDQRRLLWKRQ